MKRQERINLLEIELNALSMGMITLTEDERRTFKPEFERKVNHYQKVAMKKYVPRIGGYDTTP